MSNLLLKAVEYPSEKIIDLSDLTEIGLLELKSQLADYESQIDDCLEYLKEKEVLQ